MKEKTTHSSVVKPGKLPTIWVLFIWNHHCGSFVKPLQTKNNFNPSSREKGSNLNLCGSQKHPLNSGKVETILQKSKLVMVFFICYYSSSFQLLSISIPMLILSFGDFRTIIILLLLFSSGWCLFLTAPTTSFAFFLILISLFFIAFKGTQIGILTTRGTFAGRRK